MRGGTNTPLTCATFGYICMVVAAGACGQGPVRVLTRRHHTLQGSVHSDYWVPTYTHRRSSKIEDPSQKVVSNDARKLKKLPSLRRSPNGQKLSAASTCKRNWKMEHRYSAIPQGYCAELCIFLIKLKFIMKGIYCLIVFISHFMAINLLFVTFNTMTAYYSWVGNHI